MPENTTRREFIKKGIAFSAVAAGTFALGDIHRLYAQNASPVMPDLVAVKNGEPEILFDTAIKAAGGMGNFVRKGQTVVVKPNIGWNREPETGANTNPLLVKRIIEQCLQAGAKKVYVFDNTVDRASRCYENSGIEKAVKSAGAMMVPANHERYYHEVEIPKAAALKRTKVHELILESDVYINVPVLKHHSGAELTMAMKNQMGVVWDRRAYHSKGLHQCIADFCQFRAPDLNILDAYRVTLRNGPARARKKDVAVKKTLLLSTDIVTIDAAAAMIHGAAPNQINHIKYAHEAGIGNMELSRLNIKRITL